jgi:hypothetical protein
LIVGRCLQELFDGQAGLRSRVFLFVFIFLQKHLSALCTQNMQFSCVVNIRQWHNVETGSPAQTSPKKSMLHFFARSSQASRCLGFVASLSSRHSLRLYECKIWGRLHCPAGIGEQSKVATRKQVTISLRRAGTKSQPSIGSSTTPCTKNKRRRTQDGNGSKKQNNTNTSLQLWE